MLIRTTFILTLSEPATLPRSYGLELVKELHRKMGLTMEHKEIVPVTYSSIQGDCSVSRDFLDFQTERTYHLSLCGLEARSAKAIAELDLSPTLEILGAKFDVIDRHIQMSNYEQLYHDHITTEPEPVRHFKLLFTTPTAFAQQRTYLPLPVPLLMFRSWLAKWNYFAPVYLGDQELLLYLSEAIALKHQRTRTISFRLSRGYVNGFIGDITLQVLPHIDPLLANVASLLVNYARFAGTGMKTRLGMGQTEIISVG